MIRISRGNIKIKKRKKYLKLTKGYRGVNSCLSVFASEQLIQSLFFTYKSRKLKKRLYNKIWLYRINTYLRIYNNTYSKFSGQLKKLNILLNKKILAYLIFHYPFIFKILQKIKN